jgi:hypothetical protein
MNVQAAYDLRIAEKASARKIEPEISPVNFTPHDSNLTLEALLLTGRRDSVERVQERRRSHSSRLRRPPLASPGPHRPVG